MPQKKSAYLHLAKQWTDKHRKRSSTLLQKHADSIEWLSNKAKQTAIGTSAGLLLMGIPLQTLTPPVSDPVQKEQPQVDSLTFLVNDLKEYLPSEMRPLSPGEEEKVGEVLSRYTGLKVSAELQGFKLNRSYGLMGAEQHLARFPGDTIATHFDSQEQAAIYTKSGMAPGLGAFGYFARSQAEFTQKDNDREKYYIAVQTFLSEGFTSRFREYMQFYKYRKMVVVNPNNGKAMVVVIADSGPAAWTGKHLGGSPEVMRYLERFDGKQRGAVLYFFVDDPEDTIPLGPMKLIQ